MRRSSHARAATQSDFTDRADRPTSSARTAGTAITTSATTGPGCTRTRTVFAEGAGSTTAAVATVTAVTDTAGITATAAVATAGPKGGGVEAITAVTTVAPGSAERIAVLAVGSVDAATTATAG